MAKSFHIVNELRRDYSTQPVEIKYSECENLQTQNTNRLFVLSYSHDILSLIYQSKVIACPGLRNS